ncbi:MAG: glycosyltransferase family 4 protein [Syntrophobacterales bacterium]|nr:glycosyltransferase family 4 protein [Syntrophobacterales bacterium]
MNILIANKFFFINGGSDRYFFNIMDELRSLGHHPIPFSVRHEISKDSPYLPYFLPPPAPANQTHFANIRLKDANWLRLLDRSVYSIEARYRLSRLLRDVGSVDVAYILNIYNYMSPSIIHTLRHHKIPVVMRVGDYNLQCANYLFLRNGKPCLLCARGAYYHALKYRCVKNNIWITTLRVLSMYVHRAIKIYNEIKRFVVPCNFMKTMLISGGIPSDRIVVLLWPVILPERDINPKGFHRPYILYFGRISYEKGLDTLLEAYQACGSNMSVDLVLVGRDYDGEMARLKGMIRPDFKDRIHFIGFVEQDELNQWIKGSLFTVVPSRWYDNAPLSVYESYALAKPVVAANIGGLSEQVEDQVTGRLFTPDCVSELTLALQWMLEDRDRLETMGRNGFQKVKKENNMRGYVFRLIEVFRSVIDR